MGEKIGGQVIDLSVGKKKRESYYRLMIYYYL